jgi:serine/threonine protein kinase
MYMRCMSGLRWFEIFRRLLLTERGVCWVAWAGADKIRPLLKSFSLCANAMHGRSIIHVDFKSTNVMVDNDGNAKVRTALKWHSLLDWTPWW